MKLIPLIIGILFLHSCSNNIEGYDKEFFKSKPFDGAKGNIESVYMENYFEPNSPTDEKRYSQKVTTYYNLEGRADSMYWVQFENGDSIISQIHYYDYKDGMATRMIEERTKGNQYRKIETIFQRQNQARLTILMKDLTDPTVSIPNGFVKLDFKNQTSHYESTRDIGINQDVPEVFIKTFENRKIVKTIRKTNNEDPFTSLTTYNAEGLAESFTFVTKVFLFFDYKVDVPITYSDMDQKGNYCQSKSVYKDGEINFTLVEKLKYNYRE